MSKHLLLLVTFILARPPLYAQDLEDMEIMSREDWQADPAREGLKWHIPRYITIHHTGTNQNPNHSAVERLQALQMFADWHVAGETFRRKREKDLLY